MPRNTSKSSRQTPADTTVTTVALTKPKPSKSASAKGEGKGKTMPVAVPVRKRGRKKGQPVTKRRREHYGYYLHKVLKQVHPDARISKKSMSIMNSFVNDMFERLATEAAKLTGYGKSRTLSAR